MSNGSGLFGDQGPMKPHLVRGSGGVAGEISDLRGDIGRTVAPMAAITVDEFTNPAQLAATAVDAVLVATATVAAPVAVLAAGMIAAGLARLSVWPRPLVFTTAGVTEADAPATVLVTGTDPYGAAQTETLALAQTAADATTVKAWGSVTRVDYPAADGTDATVAIGLGATYVKAATATVAAAVELGPTDLIQTDLASNPRALVFTTAGATEADAPATATIVGEDAQGKRITEVLALAQTATTATTVNFYSEIISISYPAADGTDATIAITLSAELGLSRSIAERAGLVGAIREIAAGSLVTNGTLLAPTTTDKPYGSYAPNTAVNDTNDYAIYYEYSPQA